MGIVCWHNNLPLEHLGFSIAETPTTKYVGPNFIKRRHIKSQTLEHDFTNTKSDPLSAYCINSCFRCMCVCDVPRRDRFVTTMGDNRGMKGPWVHGMNVFDLQWSNHLVFHVRSSLLGAWRLAKSIRISHPVVFGQGITPQGDSQCLTTWTGTELPLDASPNTTWFNPGWKLALVEKVLGNINFLESTSDLGNGWNTRHVLGNFFHCQIE